MKKLLLLFAILFFQLNFSQAKNDNGQKSIPTQELSKEQIASYNNNFLKFISALRVNDRKTMEALLSDKAKKMVTEVVFKKLSEDIHFDRKTEIYKSGYKPVIDGNSYPMIQYKYSDDVATQPKEIITAVFENDGKILGIRPFSKK